MQSINSRQHPSDTSKLLTLLLVWMAATSVSAQEQKCLALFDGQSLDGWTAIGDAEFSIVESAIHGRAVPGIPNSFLRSDQIVGDFDLTLEFNVDAGFNSGVQFRSAQASERTEWEYQAGSGQVRTLVNEPGRVYGYQAEIDPSERGWTAEIHEERARGWLQTFDKEPVRRQIEPGTWHRMRIRAVGDDIRTWLDEAPVAELKDSMRSEGFIALQVHSIRAPEDAGKTVRFRNIELCTW